MSVKNEKTKTWILEKQNPTAFPVQMEDGREFYANSFDIKDEKTKRIIASVDYQTDMLTGNGWGKNNTLKMWETNAKLIVNAPEMADLLAKFIYLFNDVTEDTERKELRDEVLDILRIIQL